MSARAPLIHHLSRRFLAVNRSLLAGLVASLSLAAGGSGTAVAQGPYASVGNPGEIVPMPNNQLLITNIGNLDRTGGGVIITNFQRQLIWQYVGTLDIPHSAYPMSNGDILIADTGDNRVIEVNRASQIVWDTDNLGNGHGVLGQGTMSDGSKLSYPNDAKPLPNGDILISCRLQDRVIEITKLGKIVREIHGFLHGQHNPTPISNGNMLIADSGWDRVLEVNRQNKVIWDYGPSIHGADVLSWPRDAQPLPDRNVLITDSDNNRLIEVTKSGRIVRQYTGLSRPYAAAVLPNGNVLVGDSGYGVAELNRSDKVVWGLNEPSGGHGGSPLPTFVRNGSFEHVVPGTTWLLNKWDRNDALAYNVAPGQRVNMARDGHVHKVGRYSARITYHGSSNGVYLGEAVAVTPGAKYRFSGWIKTKNVVACPLCIYGKQSQRGHTAEFELDYNVSSGLPPVGPILNQHSGTTSWMHDTITFTVPSNVKSVDIHCELRGQGTVWFDGVWLQKLK